MRLQPLGDHLKSDTRFLTSQMLKTTLRSGFFRRRGVVPRLFLNDLFLYPFFDSHGSLEQSYQGYTGLSAPFLRRGHSGFA